MTFFISVFFVFFIVFVPMMKGNSVSFSHSFFEGSSAVCVMKNCFKSVSECMLDNSCRNAMNCNRKCQYESNQEACDLLCSFKFGYDNKPYRNVLKCMTVKNCLPHLPDDGVCLASDSETISSLTDISQMKGRWWIVRGLNCGQKGWPAGFDAFPCQYDDFTLENGEWIDHIGYCGGKDSVCETKMIHTRANVTLSSPGVLTHQYLDAPLLPQTEKWKILSWPNHGDWMLYIYCGHIPTGYYAGGSVVTRSIEGQKPSGIPATVETEFIRVAEKHGFDYHSMCLSDTTQCTSYHHPQSLIQ